MVYTVEDSLRINVPRCPVVWLALPWRRRRNLLWTWILPIMLSYSPRCCLCLSEHLKRWTWKHARAGLTINWAKTKTESDLGWDKPQLYVTQVEVVQSFVYLGSLPLLWSSEPEIKQQANIVHEAMFTLDQNIMAIHITLGSNSYQTLSIVTVWPSLDIFTVPTPCRITIELSSQLENEDLWPINLGLSTVKRSVTGQLGGNLWQWLRRLRYASGERMIHIALTHCYKLESFFT